MSKKKTRGNGEGTIYYIKNKKCWCGQITLGANLDGKLKRKTVYAKTRTEVKEKLNKIIIDIGTNKYVDKSKMLLKDMIKQNIDDKYRLNKICESSYNRNIRTLDQICNHYIGDLELQKITEYDIKDFLSFITKYKNSTIDKIYCILNTALKQAVRKNIIAYNVLDDRIEFSKPKSQLLDKDVKGFTIEEHYNFLKAINSSTNIYKYKYQYLLELYSGMRMGEINALNINDIDFTEKVIHVRRTITVDKKGRAYMGKYTKTKSRFT